MKLAGLEKGLWWSQESKRVVSPWEKTVRNGSAGASGTDTLGKRHLRVKAVTQTWWSLGPQRY